MNAQQLPLDLRWPTHQRLDRYLPTANAAALQLVREAATGAGDGWLYLCGPSGSGKTHLLIGACRTAEEAGRAPRYLPLAALPAPRAAAIASFDGSAFLAVDDVPAIAGDADAQRALFDLHNRSRATGAQMLFAANAAPAAIGLTLPDLVSRLGACTQCALKPLDDTGRRALLRACAEERGLELDDAVLDWLFARHPRDLGTLLELFERMDRAALAAQRRVTIPFLRELLRAPTS